jgi:hypothetical protein
MKILNILPLAALVILPFLPSCGGSSGGGGIEAVLTGPPVVTLVSPVDGATDVPVDTTVLVDFSVLLQKGTVNRQTFLLIERGGPGVLGTIKFQHIFIGSRPALEARFIPAASLLPCTTYDVVVTSGAEDSFHRSLTTFASSFTTTGTNCFPPQPVGPCVSPIDFGTASTYAVLAGSTITNTGPTTLDGDLGLSPGSSVTGAPSVTGVMHIADAPALQAQNDLITAYNAAAAASSTATRIGDIGGQVLTAGVYTSSSALSVETADLVLVGGPNDVFIFQMVSTLTIGSGRKVILQGVRPCNVIWQVGSSATLEVGSEFSGSILALTDITLKTGATSDGALLARNGQVVLDTNIVTVP